MRAFLVPMSTAVLVFAPWLCVELLGGREAMSALTGMDLHRLPLAALELASWTWMVFASGPWLAGSLAWLLTARTRA